MPSSRAQAPSRGAARLRHGLRAAIIALIAAALAAGGQAALAGGAAAGAGAPATTSSQAGPYPRLERLALSLLNCTRTGGWVRRDGSCRGYGSGRFSRYVRPIPLSDAISRKVARPYALRLARADACEHGLAGSSIAGRFLAAGFRGPVRGESIGCSSGYTVRQMVIRTHRMMQAERSSNGWHWRNIKDRDWRRVGIGVRSWGRESRVVYDFYGR